VVEARNRFERAGHWRPLLCGFDVLVTVLVDGAVAVEDDEFGDHAFALNRQASQIGHLVHRHMQLLEQALAVVAQREVFGIDHDVVKEGIY